MLYSFTEINVENFRQGKDKFGMSLCTVDGQRYSLGDAQEKYSHLEYKLTIYLFCFVF